MRMSMGFCNRLETRQCLSHAQKLGLKTLLELTQRLKHPEYPNTVKGLEGMEIANQVLQEKESAGILIGGLAEAIWSRKRTPEELTIHKDVDVAVLNDTFQLSEKFEKGIDWWLPYKGKFTIKTDTSSIQGVEKRWYENGNGIILSFGLHAFSQLTPGLYLPASEWVIDMRMYEAEANLDRRLASEIDDDVFEKYEAKLKEKIKTRLPKFIHEKFAGQILSKNYEQNYMKRTAVELEKFNIETIIAIQYFKKNIQA